MKNGWVGVVTAGCPVRVATSCGVLPLPAVLENSSPLVVSEAGRWLLLANAPVLFEANRVVTSPAEYGVGVELAPCPRRKPVLLTTSSSVAAAANRAADELPPDQLMKNSWLTAMLDGWVVVPKVATSWDVPPLPSEPYSSRPLLLL